MIHMDQLDMATVIVDLAAIFILFGMISYTSIYRKRNLISDRVFFAMIVTDIVMAISDALTYVLDESSIPLAAVMSMGLNTVFHSAFEILCGLWMVFILYRLYRDEKRHREKWKNVMIPAWIGVIMVILNIFLPFLYYIDAEKNLYVSMPLYNLVYLIPAAYFIVSAIDIFKLDRSFFMMFIVLVAVRGLLTVTYRGVSSTALFFAVALVFAHIYVMKTPFYEEVRE